MSGVWQSVSYGLLAFVRPSLESYVGCFPIAFVVHFGHLPTLYSRHPHENPTLLLAAGYGWWHSNSCFKKHIEDDLSSWHLCKFSQKKKRNILGVQNFTSAQWWHFVDNIPQIPSFHKLTLLSGDPHHPLRKQLINRKIYRSVGIDGSLPPWVYMLHP